MCFYSVFWMNEVNRKKSREHILVQPHGVARREIADPQNHHETGKLMYIFDG